MSTTGASPVGTFGHRATRSIVLLGVAIAMGVAVAMYQVAAFHQGYQPSADFQQFSRFVWALLLGTWVEEDSRGRLEADRPSLDLGLFMYVIGIVYLPWYLLRTRGSQGWLWIAGLIALAFLGTILQLLLYAATR
jgi:hypothetical protein